ncbi:ABC transporter substrate-binding protein [Gordonia shandongensis]|uniref:ABC transporter substrate-binding protein n=1 Tax=Gordonia shandongensis TaxID=376351 RepID=UPI0003F73E46|nr:ABC transporter substrate-binding protein [Gordonia shandongensis]
MFSGFRRGAAAAAAVAAAGLALTACSTTGSDDAAGSGETITVTTDSGTVEVPKDPQRVVVLDNTAAETVAAFDVTPAAVPKQLFSGKQLGDWTNDEAVKDVGTHNEPKFDVIEDVNPDLIIGGYRFSKYTDELKKIADASGGAFIDVAAGDDARGTRVEAMMRQTKVLGEIFGKQDQAEEIVSVFLEKLDAAKNAARDKTVFLANVNGGKIDNGAKRLSPLVEPLGLKDVFAGDAGDIHQNSGLTPEAIAQANPDWVIVMDRDAAVAKDGESPTPAAAVFDAQDAFEKTSFMTKKHIIYLDPQFYLREGIQGYGESYEKIAQAMGSGA